MGLLVKRKKMKADLQQYKLDDGIPTIQDFIVPEAVEEGRDSLYLGPRKYCRVFAISLWPRDIHVGWLNEIFSVGNVDLSVHVSTMSARRVIKHLTSKVVSAESQRLLEVKRGNIERLPELENVVRDLETIREAIQCNRDRMYYVTALIAVYGESEEDLNRRCDVLDSILARRSTEAKALIYRQVDGLKSVIPVGNLCVFGRGTFRNLTVGGLATMLPVASSVLSHSSGAFIGFTADSSPVFFDPFIGPPWLPAPHVGVFGYAGSGKSMTLKVLVGRLSCLGVLFVILDPEGEYRRAVRHLYDGEVVSVEPGVPTGINPLELEPEEDEESGRRVVNIADKVADVRALFSAVTRGFGDRGLTAREVAALEAAVREVYAERGITSDPASLYERGGVKLEDGSYAVGPVKKRMPTLSDLHAKLKEKPGAEDLCTIFGPFLRSGSLGMFDCETTVDIQAPVVSFDLSRIRDEFTRFYAMFVILSWVWHRFGLKMKGRKKIVVVDEGWMFARWPESACFLETLARRGRKHRTGLVIASQQVEEFLSREEGRSVLANCPTQFILGQNPTVAEQVVEVFKLPAGLGERLQTFGNGRCFLTMGANTAEVQVVVLPYEFEHVRTDAGQV